MKTQKNHHSTDDGAGDVSTCACFNLRKAARAVTQRFDAALDASGLRATQFSLLSATQRLGSPTISDLADRMVMDRTTLTRNLRPLEKAGLIGRAAGDDRRTRHVTLTAEGQRRLDAAMPLWRKAQSHMVDGLDGERWPRLLADLGAAVRVAQKG